MPNRRRSYDKELSVVAGLAVSRGRVCNSDIVHGFMGSCGHLH